MAAPHLRGSGEGPWRPPLTAPTPLLHKPYLIYKTKTKTQTKTQTKIKKVYLLKLCNSGVRGKTGKDTDKNIDEKDMCDKVV